MKAKVRDKWFYAISYIVSAVLLLWYVYAEAVSVSPFLRAGILTLGCVFMYSGTFLLVRRKAVETARKQLKITVFIMFLFYVIMLGSFLFFEGYFGRNSSQFEGTWTKENIIQYLHSSANFIPFKSTYSLIYGYCKGWISFSKPLLNIGGNLVAFMPFAFFLPVLSEKLRKAIPLLLSVAAVVTFVEITQLVLRCGVCDVDDLILNVTGAGIVFAVMHIKPVRKFISKITFDIY